MARLTTPVADRFGKLHARRQGVLDRNRENACLTLPHVLPYDGHTEDESLDQPYQSEAANGVNNLASKLLLTLLPPHTTPMNLDVAEDVKQDLDTKDPALRSQIDQEMLRAEKVVMEDIDSNALRPKVYNFIRNLIICGDACMFIPDKGKAKVFRMDRYVVVRDDSGAVVELITKETFDPVVLTDAQRVLIVPKEKPPAGTTGKTDKDDSVDIYTYVRFADGKVYGQQFLENAPLGNEISYKADESPWIVTRWTELDGENYGRGHVEENYGDINALENLSQSVILSAGIAAKTIFLVNPNSATSIKDLAEAPFGGFVAGSPDDVQALKVDKAADMQAATQLMNELRTQLRYVFLRNSAVQRQAERVTAEELRIMIEDLETGLGGIHSRLSEEFQRPFFKRIIGRLKKQNIFPKFDETIVKLRITTGIEAIGRGQSLSKLGRALEFLGPLEGAMSLIKQDTLVNRVFDSLGIDTLGLVKTPEEIQAEQQAAQQQQMMQTALDKGTGPAINAMAGAAQQNQPQQGS